MAATSDAARIATLAMIAAAGILALYFAVPRTVAAVLLQAGDRPLQMLQGGVMPAGDGIDTIIDSRSAAASWSDQGRLWTDLALARLVKLERAAKDQEIEPAELETVARELERGLALAPVNPHGWARLAYVRYLQRNQPGAAAALRLSFLTGPYEADMTIARLRLALAVWSNFLTEERELGRRQIRFAWLLSRDEVVELALQSQRILVFRLALVNQPQDLAIFDSMLKERSGS